MARKSTAAFDHDLLIRQEEQLIAIRAELADIKKKMVSRYEFNPVRNIAYGLVGLVLAAFVTALAAGVFTQ